ncbi:MAG: hypothetical protein OXU25_00750 [Thaumarchaeota archaeon]|nr:hypothetical protein [Nitrososphaerota archaeon]
MSGIRVTHSGLVSLGAGTLTLGLGLAFGVIVARGLPAEGYGAWGAVWALMAYAMLADPVVSYWAARECSRGEAAGRTALSASAALSCAAAAAYVAMSYALSPQGVDAASIALAAAIVPAEMARRAVASVTLSHAPHAVECAVAAGSAAKVALALALVTHMGMGLEGAIVSALAGSAAGAAILACVSRARLGGAIEWARARRWLRMSWIPAWHGLVPALSRSDVIVFTIVTGSLGGVAYWVAARTVALIAAHAERAGSALYPSLLAGGPRGAVRESLSLVLYAMFALSAMASALAVPAMRALGEGYAAAALAVPMVAAVVSMRTVANVLSRALAGVEGADADGAGAAGLARSRLFSVPGLIIMQRAAYLAALAVTLAALAASGTGDAGLVIAWAGLALAMQVPHFAHVCAIARREFALVDARRAAVHAACAAAAFGAVHAASGPLTGGLSGATAIAPAVAALAAAGTAAYVALTCAVDPATRALVRGIARGVWGAAR